MSIETTTTVDTSKAEERALIEAAVAAEPAKVRKVPSAKAMSKAAHVAAAKAGLDSFGNPKAAKGAKAAKPETKAAPTPKREPRFPTANELVLELICRHGPCQVGVVRKEWAARDKAFAALTDRQRKGVIRRAVRKLEAAGKVTKTGPIFAAVSNHRVAPKRNGNGRKATAA
jgi:hypothetical protein